VWFGLGLTIDVVTSIIVIISIGLCVDYSAHIAHAFLTSQGNMYRILNHVSTYPTIGHPLWTFPKGKKINSFTEGQLIL
jgi:predicted RND superfamily exporter protein